MIMILHAIQIRPLAEVSFTAEEADVMVQCSGAHYDALCREASEPGHYLCYIKLSPDRCHTLTCDQIDTLAKICEVGHYLSPEKAVTARNLNHKLCFLLRSFNDQIPTRFPATRRGPIPG